MDQIMIHMEDKNDYKSKDSSSNDVVKKIKCDINNININGVELNLDLPTKDPVTDLANSGAQAITEDDEQTTTANSLENGERENNNN